MEEQVWQWLLDSDEPWTRYRTWVDLLGRPESDAEVQAAHHDMLAHPLVQSLIAGAASWPGGAIKRHNDASHAIHKLTTLADFGLRADDPGMPAIVEAVLAHVAPEGPLQSVVNIPTAFGGSGEDAWAWMLCDAPSLLYALLAITGPRRPLCSPAASSAPGATSATCRPELANAANHLASLGDDNGWRCVAAPELGKFKGPGKRADPCPIANVLALKALSLVPELHATAAVRAGAEMLLGHWERGAQRPFLFGCGTDFRKLKYPHIWYDILHVAEVLTRFPFLRSDPRLRDMVEAITAQADGDGRYTAGSMYLAWKGWSFADKKRPSPWLTFLAIRIGRRMGSGA